MQILFRLSITLALAIAGVTNTRAADDPCPVLSQLRAMSADHFKQQRGKGIRQSAEDFETDYRIPGAYECKVTTSGSSHSVLTCSWFLERGLDAEPAARAVFLKTAESYQSCVNDRDGLEVKDRRASRGASVTLTDRFAGAPKKSNYAVEISYSWFAPWWYLYVEYQRFDP